MSILTSDEFCKKVDMPKELETRIKHYEYRNEMEDIKVAYDKDEQGLWHETTEMYNLSKSIKNMRKELARMEKKNEDKI